MRRYRFHEFVLSPRRRALLRNGVELPLIPRYFDLLHFLIQRRGDAVHRRDIFDAVWSDVIVSDSALSQAIRTIRRVLDDDPREPRFVRTVSRHGYQFVWADVVEEADTADEHSAAVTDQTAVRQPAATPAEPPVSSDDAIETLLARILHPGADDEEQRDAAERLHALGTPAVLARLDARPEHARVRALLRDTRWDTPLAGPVPLLGTPRAAQAIGHLVTLRLRRAAGLAAARWVRAATGGALAGAAGGTLGGTLLVAVGGSATPSTAVPVLAAIGFICGGLAGAGVGAGMAAADAILRSGRTLGLVVGGAAGGGAIGLAIQLESRWLLQLLVNAAPPIGGGVDGFVLGAATAAGYALATSRMTDGSPAPRGRARARVALVTAACAGAGALLLAATGRPLVGGTVHLIARAIGGHELFGPLGALIGEPDFGVVTAALIASGEGLIFGLGVALGLTRRG
ncbi:MAG: transcriptional regulator [Vicinamibacterales bacterium]